MTNQILRLPEVKRLTGLSRSSIYQKISDGVFPKQIHIGANSVGWLHSDIQNWISEIIQRSGGADDASSPRKSSSE